MIANELNYSVAIGTGAISTYNTGIKAYSATQFEVYIGTATDLGTKKILNTDYTVTNLSSLVAPGLATDLQANIVLSAPLANTAYMRVFRKTSDAQNVSISTQRAFDPASLEVALDLHSMALQEVRRDSSNAIRGLGVTLPFQIVPGKVLSFDVNGNPEAIIDKTDVASAAASIAAAIAGAGIDRNYLMNNDFRLWTRNTFVYAFSGTYAGAGYGGPDLWLNQFSGGTSTITRPTFAISTALGSSDPRVYLQQTVASQTLAAHYAYVSQRITPVDRYQGRQITITGWILLPDGAGNIAVSAQQNFGTGGSPSASVVVNGVLVPGTTSWTRFKATLNIPSIAGKTRGTNATSNEHIEIRFWNSAGTDYAAETAGLGLQNRRMALWGLEIHHGDVPATAADNFRIPEITESVMLCQRFYQFGTSRFDGQATNASNFSVPVKFNGSMRVVPTVVFTNVGNTNFGTASIQEKLTEFGLYEKRLATGTGAGYFESTYEASAEL